MPRPSEFLSPARVVAGLKRRRARARQLNQGFRARHAERRDFGGVPRTDRDSCWCGGSLGPFAPHPAFGVCEDCGCFVNRHPPEREHLDEVYSLDAYWRRRQTMRGYPAIEERGDLYRKDGRLDVWLGLVADYGPTAGRAIEVGCAPGAMLAELRDRDYDCVGVEIDAEVAAWIRDDLDIDVRAGFFPGVELPPCDVFLAFDVLEHSPCPDAFMREAGRLLNPGGTAIVQTAIDRGEYEAPFGHRDDLFDELEHLFLFTEPAMEALGELGGLEVVGTSRQRWIGGEICVFRKGTDPKGEGG